MTVNLQARDYQIVLSYPDGSNPLNVRSLVQSCVVSNSHLDESGLVTTSGVLKLHAFPLTAFAESLNPRLNQSRWAKRCRVTIDVADESGDMSRHPRGRLRILKFPKVPSRRDGLLELPIGCLLSLQDYRQPPGDDSEVEPGTLTPRHIIINRLAARAKLPNLVDSIPEWEIDFPVSRLSGSYVDQMGQLAFAAGYCLWIDNDEQLRATKIPNSPPPDFTLVIGKDETVYEPLEPDESPCEIVRSTCTYPRVKPTLNPEPTWSTSRTDDFSPSEVAYQSWNGMGTATTVAFRRSRQPLGLVMPDQYPDSPTLTNAAIEYDYAYYAEDDEGFLTKEETITREPKGVVFPDTNPGEQADIFSKKVETYYRYENSAVVEIQTYTYEPQGVIDPSNTNLETRSLPGLASYESQRWKKTNKGWEKTESSRSFKVGGTSSSGTTFSGSGNNQPPAPEQRQQPYYLEEESLTAAAKFAEVPGLEFDERGRTFEIPTASSKEQLRYVAKLIGRRLWGQQQGVSWGMDLRDEWLDYRPFKCLDVVEIDELSGEAIQSRYVSTGETFSMTQRQCAVAGDGLHWGRVRRYRTDGSEDPPTEPTQEPDPNEAEFLAPPYREVTQVGAEGAAIADPDGLLAMVGGFTVLPYAADSGSTTFSGTLSAVGNLAEQEPIAGLLEFFSVQPAYLNWNQIDLAAWDAIAEGEWDRVWATWEDINEGVWNALSEGDWNVIGG